MKCRCPACQENQIDCSITNSLYQGLCFWCAEHCRGELFPERARKHELRVQAALDALEQERLAFIATCPKETPP